MGISKRIYFRLLSEKRRTLIMTGIFGIISVIFLYFISLYYVLEVRKSEVGTEVDAYVAIRNTDMDEVYPGPIGLGEESKKKIDGLDGIKKTWESCAVSVMGDTVRFWGYKDGGIPLEAEESTGCLLYTSDWKEHPFFKETGHLLTSGDFQQEEGSWAVISSDLSSLNNMNTGDKKTVRTMDGRELQLEITGITDISDSMEWCNCIFTSKAAVFDAMGSEPGYREVRYYLEDAAKAGKFINGIKDLELPESADLEITSNLLAYQQTLSVIENVQRLLWSSLGLILVLSVLILSLLYLHELLEREKEFGILLAMGERRHRILLQFLGEIAVPMGAAVLAALVIAKGTLIVTEKYLAPGWGINSHFVLDIRSVVVLLLCNLLIVLVLVTAAGVIVFRQKLRSMLEKGE